MSSSVDELVREVLSEYGEVSKVALTSYTRMREPLRHLYGLVADYPTRGGRMLRPSICLANAVTHGAKSAQAIAPAVSIELLHNAFLVHDDIEDASEYRRGCKTLHEKCGIPLAVNTGDALCLLSLQALADAGNQLGWSTLRILEDELRTTAFESVEGQAIELGWRRDNSVQVSIEDYLHMILKKTCWYTIIFPLRAGATVAWGRIDNEAFKAFGFFLGAAFQIQDDVLNLIGDVNKYGKEINGDLREGKRTLMLIHLLRELPGFERSKLVEILDLPLGGRSESDVGWIREKMSHHGSIEYARAFAHSMAGAALSEFDSAFKHVEDSRERRFLRGLCTWVLSRA